MTPALPEVPTEWCQNLGIEDLGDDDEGPSISRQVTSIHRHDALLAQLDHVLENVDYVCSDYLLQAAEAIKSLEAQVNELIAGYKECLEDLQSWAAYANEYFQRKYDLKGTIARHAAAIENARSAKA